MSMTTAGIATCALIVLGAATFVQQGSAPANTDMPISTAELVGVQAKADSSKTSLAQAIALAEKEVGGKAYTASIVGGSAPAAEVVVMAGGNMHRVTINTETESVSKKDTSETTYTYPGEAVEGAPVTTSTGLKYFDIKEGTGNTPRSTASMVRVHYTGWLVDGKKFDSSVDRGQPLDFALDGVIPGWTEGVSSMKVGGKRKLVIPGYLGYGKRGTRGIPPDATLIFDVELLEVVGETNRQEP